MNEPSKFDWHAFIAHKKYVLKGVVYARCVFCISQDIRVGEIYKLSSDIDTGVREPRFQVLDCPGVNYIYIPTDSSHVIVAV